MSAAGRFGLALILITIYGSNMLSMPDGIPEWQYFVIQMSLTVGLVLFIMFGGRNDD